MQSFELGANQAQFLAYFDGVDANTLQVLVGGVIFGLDGKREGLNRAEMEGSHLFDVALLVFELAEIKSVRAVNQIHRGQNEQGCFPVEGVIEPGDHTSNTGS